MADYIILQVMVSVFVAFAISRSFLRWKARNSTVSELLLWSTVWIIVLVVVWVPKLTEIPAQIFGIGRGIDAAVYVAIMVLLYSVYRIYSKIERIEQEITTLTRHAALDRKKR
jgi:small membrane protein